MRGASTQRGLTILEIMIVVVVFAILSSVFTDVFMSSNNLVVSARGEHRARERLRRNLEAISNVLRGAALDTLDGFDESESATTLQFARVESVDRHGPIFLGTETLVWRASATSVDGIDAPGELVHTLDGDEVVLATRIPASGFSARFEDGTLVIELRTYYSSQGRATVVAGETAIALRN